jgi:O-antigen ligase
MSKNKKSHIDKKPPINFLFIGVALITLGIYTNFYDPFNTPKLIILILVASITFSHLVSDYHINGFFVSNLDKLIFFVLIFFTAGLILATFSSNEIYISVLGDTQRRNGFLQYFSLIIILVYSSRVINFSYAENLVKYVVIVSFILSSYGLLQVSGKDFIKWDNPYNSMIGTLGNPNFASALLAVLLVVIVAEVTNKRISVFYKLIAIVAAIMSIVCIFLSDSRQGLLTFGAGFLFYISLTMYYKNKKVGLSLILISTILLILSIFGMLQKGPLASYLYKDSVSVRGFYWRAAVDMLQNNIFTGVGLDRYGSYFKLYREAEYPLRYGFNINNNNAHNVFLQFFATGGVLLGLSYLVLCVVVFILGLRLIRNSETELRRIAITLLSAWIAFQSQSFISIDSIGISIWGWIIPGAILGLVRNDGKLIFKSNQAINQIASSNKKIKIEIYQKFVLVLVLVPTLTFSYFQSKSESDTLKTRFFTAPGREENKPVVAEYSKMVIDNKFSDPAYKLLTLTYLYEMGFENEAYSEIKKLEALDPINLDVLNSLALISQRLGNNSDLIETRERIARLDPWNAENYFELVKLYKLIGNLELARINYNNIISFAPNIEIAIQAEKIIR